MIMNSLYVYVRELLCSYMVNVVAVVCVLFGNHAESETKHHNQLSVSFFFAPDSACGACNANCVVMHSNVTLNY